MPNFIAVELKVIEQHAPAVARAAACSEDRVLAGLNRLWHYCWSNTTDEIDLDGLASLFGGERIETLAKCLMVREFLDDISSAGTRFRVRGAEKYLRLKAARARGAKLTNERRSKSARPARSKSVVERALPDALSPNTEHRTPKETTSPPAAPVVVPNPRHAPLVKLLVDAFEKRFGTRYAFTGRDAKAVTNLIAKAGDVEVLRRWAIAMTNQFRKARCIHELDSRWNDFVEPESTAGPPKGAAYRDKAATDWSDGTSFREQLEAAVGGA